ncbi:MAG: molybdenum cofactor guanylyltransferase [Planctomyces sp.]|jgi:molybdopterin-guanine dinucleotide biosynthesis protein A
MRPGAILLCGGRSTRMGRDKSRLPFGDDTLLLRVLRRVAEGLQKVCDAPQIVVVSAADQVVEQLPAGVRTVVDTEPCEGPLRGLEAGLSALSGTADTIFVTSCDAPFLEPAVVELLLRRLQGRRGLLVSENATGRLHPLCAVYTTGLLADVRQLLASGERRMRALAQLADVAQLEASELRTVDASLCSLQNINEPEDYQAALEKLIGGS